REIGEDGAVIELGGELLGDRERDARLPCPTGPDERDQACLVAQQRSDSGDLEPPADEVRDCRGQRSSALGCGSLCGVEARILAKHCALELAKRGRRLEAELVAPRCTRGAIRVEGVRLTACAIQRE